MYAKKLANKIRDVLFTEHGCYSFDEKVGLFRFRLNGQRDDMITMRVQVLKDSFIVYGLIPVPLHMEDKGKVTEMSMLLCRINSRYPQKFHGNFQLDFCTGYIYFKCGVWCKDFIRFDEVIKNSIYDAAVMCDLYSHGIYQVIAGATSESAIGLCDKSIEDFEYRRKVALEKECLHR